MSCSPIPVTGRMCSHGTFASLLANGIIAYAGTLFNMLKTLSLSGIGLIHVCNIYQQVLLSSHIRRPSHDIHTGHGVAFTQFAYLTWEAFSRHPPTCTVAFFFHNCAAILFTRKNIDFLLT